MAIEMNKAPNIRLTPVQEIKLAKPATELYVGQILKTVVVTALSNDQVLININGQNLNAQSSHRFIEGEWLEVKVIANAEETVLEVQHPHLSSSVLQNTLLLTLPKQAPPTSLLNTLTQLVHFESLPASIQKQIAGILRHFVSVAELPQQLKYAINQSGLFFESTLLKWQRGMNPWVLRTDFKGQCLKLLSSLPTVNKKSSNLLPSQEALLLDQDPLPLPGAIPQPLHQDSALYLPEQPPGDLQSILAEQLTRVIARITASQVNHLAHGTKDGYFIMLDLPVRTPESVDVIPLMIKQHQAKPMQQSKWCLSFALSLSQLGDMQASVSLHSNTIDIKINAQKPDTIDILNEYQQEIRTLLGKLGLNLHHWQLQLGLENNHIDVPNLRLLDIRI